MPDQSRTERTNAAMMRNVITALLTAGLVGSWGWIVKMEVSSSESRARDAETARELRRLEDELKESRTIEVEVRGNSLELARIGQDLQTIKERVSEIKSIVADL